MNDGLEPLPTHLSLIQRRLTVVGSDSSADTFLTTSYLIEATIKTVTLVLSSGIRRRSPQDAYRIQYDVVRADGLGTWADAIIKMIDSSQRRSFPPSFLSLCNWLVKKRTKPEDAWFRDAVEEACIILRQMGQDVPSSSLPTNLAGLYVMLVGIRNKTKAHGAFGPDFFAAANPHYENVAYTILRNCPVCDWSFAYTAPVKGQACVWLLSGLTPRQVTDLDLPSSVTCPSIYVIPTAGEPVEIPLIITNRELTSFYVPNGRWNDRSKTAEFIDYATGKTVSHDCSNFARAPVKPPRSETHGESVLDVCSNVWGNLPISRPWYAPRRKLQGALMERLLDRNHAIVTLHGIGGIGKTSLALWAAHELSGQSSPRFDQILWFSARDLDLRQSGPSPVTPAVVTLSDIARTYGTLMESGTSVEDLAEALRQATDGGTLFIFDNFETISSPRELHEFLDTHTHLPNKILITSRERAFKADFPIEITGMDWAEGEVVILQTARRFHVEGIVDAEKRESIWKHAEGHPYLMQILVGEAAAAGKYVPPRTVIGRRSDVLDAIFERSFAKLTDAGRWCFLMVANWQSAIPEISLYAVGMEQDIDVESGTEECVRLSLMNESELLDGQVCYEAPQVARLFGRKKLMGDPDRLAIQAHLEIVREFGVVKTRGGTTGLEASIRTFFERAIGRVSQMTEDEQLKTDGLLRRVAEQWPPGWLLLAKFRSRVGRDYSEIDEAARRAVEERPHDVAAWRERAEYARRHGDQQTEVVCWVSMVEVEPSDVELVNEAANRLNQYVGQIPLERRIYYIASVRDRMEGIVRSLDATGRSRLAWLYLHEENYEKAKEHVQAGLKLDWQNAHCRKLDERLAM
ncbi:MAG: NB-ARC domain-containing protein [Planctomycetota bacterium]|nr:NB-ARC domain-containing protein [Planctomycetota bacterium]